MINVLECLGITEETHDSLMEELELDSGIVTMSDMIKRIVEVAQGKPTNEVLYLGAVLMWTLQAE